MSVLLAFSSNALPSHEPDHRYTVFGEVRTTEGTPLPNASVRITGIGGKPLGQGVSDDSGRYRIVLHLHNQDLGLRFWISVETRTQTATVTFNPSNPRAAREHRIDFPPLVSQ